MHKQDQNRKRPHQVDGIRPQLFGVLCEAHEAAQQSGYTQADDEAKDQPDVGESIRQMRGGLFHGANLADSAAQAVLDRFQKNIVSEGFPPYIWNTWFLRP
jgi:hypothetical protein